jgi:uncharacterized membrane protein YkvA (DUF1232 family)
MRRWFKTLRQWATIIKLDVVTLWIASRDSKTPFAAKFFAGMIAAYALSPVDLIPDFIPIFGYLDDLLIVPLGVKLALKLIPAELLEDFRLAARGLVSRPVSKAGPIAIIAIWVVVTAIAFASLQQDLFEL